MGILKNFFLMPNYSRSESSSVGHSTKVRYRAVCKVCGRSCESSDPGRAVRVVQDPMVSDSSGCGRGNHDIQVFQI